jgi:hypothetical protein
MTGRPMTEPTGERIVRDVIDRRSNPLKITVNRAIPVVAVVSFVLLNLSGLSRYKHAHGTVDSIVSDFVWFGFLLTALATIVLIAVAVRRAVVRRRTAATA